MFSSSPSTTPAVLHKARFLLTGKEVLTASISVSKKLEVKNNKRNRLKLDDKVDDKVVAPPPPKRRIKLHDFLSWETKMIYDGCYRKDLTTNMAHLQKHLNKVELSWPRMNRPNQMIYVTAKNLVTTVMTCQIQFYNSPRDEKSFLTLDVNPQHQDILTVRHDPNISDWSREEVDDMLCYFQRIFLNPRVKSVGEKKQKTFSKDEFMKAIELHRTKGINGRAKFLFDCAEKQIDWGDAKNPNRKLTLYFDRVRSSDVNMKETCFTEEAWLKLHYPNTNLRAGILKYYHLVITEENNKLLELWFTLDGMFGELYKLFATTGTSGTQVLTEIFEVFMRFLQLQITYVYDDTFLRDGKSRLHLRTIRSITRGEPWYSQYGRFRLFAFQNLQTKLDGVWSQDPLAHAKAIQHLQKISIEDFAKELAADPKKPIFDDLVAKNSGVTTFKELVSRIEEKTKRDKTEMRELVKIIYFDYPIRDDAPSLHALRIIKGSRIFVREREDKQAAVAFHPL
jgi:hypothetical protein